MPLVRGKCPRCATAIAVIAAIFIAGCAVSPSISVLGAYFPDWLFCIVAGVVLTIIVFLILKRLQYDRLLGPPPVVYPAFVALCSLAVWLMLFQH